MQAIIIGTGAVAAFLGAALEERGFLPGYVGRQGPTAFTARLAYPGGAERLVCCRAPGKDVWRAAALAFVAVKAFDLEAAFGWASELAPGTPLIPVVNGAVEDLVRAAAARRPDLAWRLGYSTFGVSALDAPAGPQDAATSFTNHSYAVRSRTGEVAFGPLDGRGEPAAAERLLLDRPGVFVWHQGILKAARRKWLFNVVINTLCAARGLRRNGDLFGDIPMLSAVFHEAWALGEGRFGPWGLEKAEVYKAMEKLIEATAENENSMARDKRLGRLTETAYLAGLATDARRFPLLTMLAGQAR